MPIDYTKRGLRLGYLIRGRYHTQDGQSRRLRLSGPTSRVGTGYTAPDPDDGAQWPERRYWRAGTFNITTTESVGKLDQYIQIPGRLSLSVPLDYPADPNSEVHDPTDDQELRAAVVSGRWANKDVDLWWVDLDTGETEHRFRGQWDRDPDSEPGAFTIRAKEALGPLAVPWKVTIYPQGVPSNWIDDAAQNLAPLFIAPTVLGTGRGYVVPETTYADRVGCVFGYNDGATTNTTPAPVWREILFYGSTQGFGNPSPPVGNSTDEVLWFHVSPQFGCGVGVIRFVGDDGTVYQNGSSGVGTAILVGHNRDPNRGPVGTFCTVQVLSGVSSNFNPRENGNKAYARIHGPGANDPTTVEWHPTYLEPYTTLSGGGAMTPTLDHAGDILELLIEDSDYLDRPDLLGTGAIADFKARAPSAVAEYPEYLSAVPVEVRADTELTYRDVVSNLVGGLPADLLYRYDTAASERRLYPWWRRPGPTETEADWVIRDFDLVSSQPPSVRQLMDPSGEYGNQINVLAPEYILQPTNVPIGDASYLDNRTRNSLTVENVTEQGTTAAGAVVARDRSWKFWSPHSEETGRQHSEFIGAELSQPQVYTEADLGGEWFKIQLGDTVRYEIHGLTERIGMVRSLEYDLEAQTVTVRALHITFYDASEISGDGDGDGD